MSTATASAPRASALYRGTVRHDRRSPKPHRFEYSLFLLYLDLGELDEVFRGRWLWSLERFNVASFRRRDYLGDARRPLRDCVQERVSEVLGSCPDGPIRVLTHLRYLGLGFNPVTFYYVFEPGGERLHSVVAEITNTPWEERHSYVLPWSGGQRTERGTAWEFSKAFHVSPFFPMELDYRWELGLPGEQLQVWMDNLAAGEHQFSAGLDLQRRPLNGRHMAGALLRHPWMTAKVGLGIYWQALRLWLKRVPFHTHPSKRAAAETHG